MNPDATSLFTTVDEEFVDNEDVVVSVAKAAEVTINSHAIIIYLYFLIKMKLYNKLRGIF